MKYHVIISGNSIGGTAYVQRIVNAAIHRKRIHVLVNHGAYQDRIVNKLKRDLVTLKSVATHKFEVRIYKEAPEF